MAEIRRAAASKQVEVVGQALQPHDDDSKDTRRKRIGSKMNLKKELSLWNASIVFFPILLYSVMMGAFGGGIRLIDSSPLRMTTISTSDGDGTTTAEWIGTDWHSIHYNYMMYKYPRQSFDALAGEYARVPPSRDEWNPPMDIQGQFDHTIQPAKSGPTVNVVIGVLSDESSPTALERRTIIRATWGAVPSDSNKKHHSKNTVFFVVGGSDITKELEQEMLQYQDLVWVQTAGDKLVADHIKAMVFNAAAIKYIPTLRHLLIVEDTSYVRVAALEEASAHELKNVGYFGHCMPNEGDDVFYPVPTALQVSFPHSKFPKSALAAFMATWKIARCVSHIASTVPPLPVSAGINMGIMARDCRVPCTHDERVQSTDTLSNKNTLIHLNVTDLRKFHETVTAAGAVADPFAISYQLRNMPFP